MRSLDWDSELCMSRVSRERKVQVLESFERFCCAKICKDQSLKQEPLAQASLRLKEPARLGELVTSRVSLSSPRRAAMVLSALFSYK
ncbi:hypothetical protein HKD37_09G024971 [Glycine soja]